MDEIKEINIERNKIGIFERLIVIWGALTPFFTSISFFFIIQVAYIILIGLALIFGDILENKGSRYKYSWRAVRWIILFAMLLGLGTLWTSAPEYGLAKCGVLIGWVVYFAIIAGYIKDNLALFMKINIGLFICYVILLVICFGNPISLLNTVLIQGRRLGVYYGDMDTEFNPIWLARYIGFLLLSFIFYNLKWKRPLFTFSFYLVAILYLIEAASKGPILALIMSAGLFIYRTKKKKLFLWLIIGVVGISSLIFILGAAQSSFIDERFSFDSSSTDSRIGLINEVLSSSENEIGTLLLGAGTGAAGYLITGTDKRAYPHNIGVEVLCENGIFGFLILLTIIGYVWRVYRKNKDVNLIPFCFFIYFFFNAQFSGDLMFNQYMFMFYFITVVQPRKNKKIYIQ